MDERRVEARNGISRLAFEVLYPSSSHLQKNPTTIPSSFQSLCPVVVADQKKRKNARPSVPSKAETIKSPYYADQVIAGK
jgi:hypothetical protein